MEEKGEMLTGLTVKKANRSQWLEEREISRRLGPGNSCKESLQTQHEDHSSFSLLPLQCRNGFGGIPLPPGRAYFKFTPLNLLFLQQNSCKVSS
jgi:hypothetical protein